METFRYCQASTDEVIVVVLTENHREIRRVDRRGRAPSRLRHGPDDDLSARGIPTVGVGRRTPRLGCHRVSSADGTHRNRPLTRPSLPRIEADLRDDGDDAMTPHVGEHVWSLRLYQTTARNVCRRSWASQRQIAVDRPVLA